MAKIDGIDYIAAAIFAAANSSTKIMVRNYNGKCRHLRVRRNGKGYYVRTGKRGASKEYVTGFEIVCRDPLVIAFTTPYSGRRFS